MRKIKISFLAQLNFEESAISLNSILLINFGVDCGKMLIVCCRKNLISRISLIIMTFWFSNLSLFVISKQKWVFLFLQILTADLYIWEMELYMSIVSFILMKLTRWYLFSGNFKVSYGFKINSWWVFKYLSVSTVIKFKSVKKNVIRLSIFLFILLLLGVFWKKKCIILVHGQDKDRNNISWYNMFLFRNKRKQIHLPE